MKNNESTFDGIERCVKKLQSESLNVDLTFARPIVRTSEEDLQLILKGAEILTTKHKIKGHWRKEADEKAKYILYRLQSRPWFEQKAPTEFAEGDKLLFLRFINCGTAKHVDMRPELLMITLKGEEYITLQQGANVGEFHAYIGGPSGPTPPIIAIIS